MNINWNKYNELYPDRYIQHSDFDIKIHQILEFLSFLKRRLPLVILDIGSGVNGSIPMDHRCDNHCYSLDPYVDTLPKDYLNKVLWSDENIKYDVVLCRGSFNYLNESEIEKCLTFLKDDGLFIFNTFGKPGNTIRSYTKNGVIAGIEEISFTVYDGVIRHKLIPNNSVSLITHTIQYYSEKKISEFFEGKIITKENVNKNSVYYIIQNNL